MGLAEKRAIEGFKAAQMKEFETQVNNMVGKNVTFNIKWDDFSPALENYDDKANALNDYMEHMFIKPVLMAFGSLTSDAMGKSALQESLKQIEMTNSNQHYGESGVKFEGGNLHLDFMYANTAEYSDRAHHIQTKIEKAL